MEIRYLLCADWGKDVRKRRCCFVDVKEKSFQILDEPELTFERLLEIGMAYGDLRKTLLSLDLAIGVPTQFLRLAKSQGLKALSFLDWLRQQKPQSDFWTETKVAAEWSAKRPFIAVPKGKGSLRKFYQIANHDLKRESDRMYGGKSPFIVSGIPGTVGSGTRSFWGELQPHLEGKRQFGLWPFDGNLCSLFKKFDLVVAENYPAISYTAVFSKKLPGKQLLLSKTYENVRAAAVNELADLEWIQEEAPTLPDLDACIRSEDNFDALMAALAQFRMLTTRFGLVAEELADSYAEGGILGNNAIEAGRKLKLDTILRVTPPRKRKRSAGESGSVAPHKCPICGHVFKQGRNGWRDHVKSLRRHPSWHPDVLDANRRQELFQSEYPGFFNENF